MRHIQVTSLESVLGSLILANIFWISAKVTTFLTMHFLCQGFAGCKEFGWTHLLYRVSWVTRTKGQSYRFLFMNRDLKWPFEKEELQSRTRREEGPCRCVFISRKKKMDNIFQKNVFYIPGMFALCKRWKFLDVYKASHRYYLAGQL